MFIYGRLSYHAILCTIINKGIIISCFSRIVFLALYTREISTRFPIIYIQRVYFCIFGSDHFPTLHPKPCFQR